MKISCSIWHSFDGWNEVEQHNDITITSSNILFGNGRILYSVFYVLGTHNTFVPCEFSTMLKMSLLPLPTSRIHLLFAPFRIQSVCAFLFSSFFLVCLLSRFARRSLLTFNELPFSIINRITIIIDYDFMLIIGIAK